MKSPDEAPPPRRYTSPTGRVVIPVLVVVLLIVILGRPILISGLDLDEEPPAPASTGPDTSERDEGPGPSRLATRYPASCRRDGTGSAPGLIAASYRDSIGVNTPEGDVAFALRAEPPVGFSAGGRFLATAGADLWSPQGDHLGLAFKRPVAKWAWAPTGDCLVGVDRGRLMVVRPTGPPDVLVRGVPVTTFSFSPTGTRLVFAVDDGSRARGIWMADLGAGKVKQLQDTTGWRLMAWSRATRPILLQDAGGGGSGLSFAPSDEVAYCGTEVVTILRQRLATFGVSGAPTYVPADRRFRYTAVSCEPDGRLLVAVRYPKGDPTATSVVVLRSDGSFVTDFGDASTVEDHPMWGPSGTGVVYVGGARGRSPGEPLVWFVPEGGNAKPTGLQVERYGQTLDPSLDWSATTPLGHPTD